MLNANINFQIYVGHVLAPAGLQKKKQRDEKYGVFLRDTGKYVSSLNMTVFF